MTIDYTVNALLNSLKIKGSVPTANGLFSTDDFLSLASDAMLNEIVPTILSVKEDYYTTNLDVPIVANQAEYSLPTRAVAAQIRDVCFVNGSGSEIDIERISPFDPKYSSGGGYYFRDDKLILWPNTIGNGNVSLRFKYPRRPNRLTANANAMQITTIVGGTEFRISATPAWAGTGTGIADVIKGTPHFSSLGDGATGTLADFGGYLAWSFYTFPATFPSVGDWICEAGESPISQIPYEAFGWLSQLTAAYALKAMADPRADNAIEEAEKLKKLFLDLITPRSDGQAKKLKPRKGIFESYFEWSSPRGRYF